MVNNNKATMNLLESSLENIEQVKPLFKERKYLEAGKYYLKAIKADPGKRDKRIFCLGKNYYILNKLTESEKELKNRSS